LKLYCNWGKLKPLGAKIPNADRHKEKQGQGCIGVATVGRFDKITGLFGRA